MKYSHDLRPSDEYLSFGFEFEMVLEVSGVTLAESPDWPTEFTELELPPTKSSVVFRTQ